MTFYILIFQVVYYWMECHHDYHVIESSDPREKDHNGQWHKWSAAHAVAMNLVIAWLAGNWWLLFTGLSIRLLLLQVLLNELRGINPSYLGSGPVDSFCRIYFGLTGTIVVKFILLAEFITLALL